MKTSKKMLSLLLIAAMLVSVLCMGVSATGYDEVSIGTGEPVTINWTTATTGTVVNVDASTNYIPKSFLLWARNGLTVKVGTTELTANGVGDTDSAYTVYTDATNEITITVLNGETVAYTITCPHYTTAITGSYPSAVNGYLPVGQFARHNSFGWGTLFTDNTNKNPDTNTPKFLDGYVSTGVSLGMAGGYVQFDMGDNPIENNANNPYGIDFIVYGNAFVGNPEAAGVMVSNDGIKWYTLAGSRHYMNGTKWDQKISYVRIEGSEQRALKSGTFTADGVYYSKNYNSPSEQTQSAINAAISAANWDVVPASGTGSALNLSYWPEWATRVVNNTAQEEYYGNVWKLGTDSHIPAVASTENNAGVNWDKADTTSTVPNGAEVITYSGLTLVPDDTQVLGSNPTQAQMTDVYQWGYADVRVNGSAYGTAINPYASAASVGNGGDGFDLSWAVDANGVPHPMTSAKYIRVYSAVLFNAGIFGETSAEVCGLYRTSNTITGGAGTTAVPTITVAGQTITLDMLESKGNNVYYFDAFGGAMPRDIAVTATAATSTAKVLINGSSTTTFTTQSTTRGVQILVQDGNSAPFILVVR
jgi:hypothetical protein